MQIKKLLISMLSFACLTSLCVGMVGCDSTPTPPADSKPESESESETLPPPPVYTEQSYKIHESLSKVKIIGRSTVLTTGVACDNTAAGIEFSAYTAGDVTVSVSCLNDSGRYSDAYFTVYVDGVRLETRYHAQGGGKITVTGLENGEHHFRIIKQTEACNSLCIFKKITLVGELRDKPADRPLYIEFLGDSVAAAYGNLVVGSNYTNPNNTNGASAECQDATQAFPFLTAEKLNADLSVIAYSGIGLHVCAAPCTILDYYTKTSYLRDEHDPYDFENARVPDLIVMDLAQNDVNTQQNASSVVKKARELITEARDRYGKDVPIVWTHDMNGGCFSAEIGNLIKQMGGAEKGLYTLRLPENFGGANGHPTKEAHEASAQVLSDFIRQVLGL